MGANSPVKNIDYVYEYKRKQTTDMTQSEKRKETYRFLLKIARGKSEFLSTCSELFVSRELS